MLANHFTSKHGFPYVRVSIAPVLHEFPYVCVSIAPVLHEFPDVCETIDEVSN